MSTAHADYRFGDDTTTVTVPGELSVALSPDEAQPDYQDTASFLVRDADGQALLELTASHFSSGNRAANMDRFRAIIDAKVSDAAPGTNAAAPSPEPSSAWELEAADPPHAAHARAQRPTIATRAPQR